MTFVFLFKKFWKNLFPSKKEMNLTSMNLNRQNNGTHWYFTFSRILNAKKLKIYHINKTELAFETILSNKLKNDIKGNHLLSDPFLEPINQFQSSELSIYLVIFFSIFKKIII